MASDSPSDNKLVVRVEDGDELGAKLLALGNRLKPVDDENFFFFEIVRELVDAVLTNYRQLRQSYVDRDYPRLAWACRNLLELTIFLKYVLLSESNARRFADDRLVDGCEIIGALRALELHYDPASSVGPLDGLLTGMRSQMAAEGVTSTKHLEVRNLAETVGHLPLCGSLFIVLVRLASLNSVLRPVSETGHRDREVCPQPASSKSR